MYTPHHTSSTHDSSQEMPSPSRQSYKKKSDLLRPNSEQTKSSQIKQVPEQSYHRGSSTRFDRHVTSVARHSRGFVITELQYHVIHDVNHHVTSVARHSRGFVITVLQYHVIHDVNHHHVTSVARHSRGLFIIILQWHVIICDVSSC